MTDRKVKVTLKENVVSVALTKEMNKKRMKNGKAKGSLDIHSYSIQEWKDLIEQNRLSSLNLMAARQMGMTNQPFPSAEDKE